MAQAVHKTVFVLDHTPYFGISCEAPIEFDFIKSRTPSYVPMKPISKSLWTCSVESAIEYCRITWDLFPSGKLIKFIASDSDEHVLNGWNSSQQSVAYIMNSLGQLGVPPARTSNPCDHTVIHGLRAAIKSLSEDTREKWDDEDKQKKKIHAPNRCRVVCITSARDDSSMARLEEIFHSVLQQQNKLCQLAIDDKEPLIKIDHCQLVIINAFPVTTESKVTSRPMRNLSEILTSEVHSIKAVLIANKLSSEILKHYDLASTTVTGIPMKEEQNASSSANYDVEIYHESLAHEGILRNHSESSVTRTMKDSNEYETVTLKWCTPRSCSAAEMQNCTSMHRITPVDVNSRPSLCLINFLLNGRSVMLEMSRKTGGKITSHLLAAHGGEIFIHTLSTSRSVLEDPPSISEGCGGRVTDYRITDFCALIRQNRLLPLKPGKYKEVPMLKMKQRVARQTAYWPLTISSTILFNMKTYIEPLPTIIAEEKISDEEVNKCKQIIYNLIGQESKHESLHLTNLGPRFKGLKREEQYKYMWKELETLIKCNLHSDQHKAILACLYECHQYNPDSGLERVVDTKDADPNQRASVIRATTDSPMSPPQTAHGGFGSAKIERQEGPMSLYDIAKASAKVSRPRVVLPGRGLHNAKAVLYANVKTSERTTKSEPMIVE